MKMTPNRVGFMLAALIVIEAAVCAYAGYEAGIHTPCVDEEQFEIHPME